PTSFQLQTELPCFNESGNKACVRPHPDPSSIIDRPAFAATRPSYCSQFCLQQQMLSRRTHRLSTPRSRRRNPTASPQRSSFTAKSKTTTFPIHAMLPALTARLYRRRLSPSLPSPVQSLVTRSRVRSLTSSKTTPQS